MLLIDDYKLEYKLGSGSFADVYYTSKKGTNQIYATKRVDKTKALSDKMKNYFLNEVDILKNTQHQNIIRLHEIKNSQKNFYLIMEYCNGGTLESFFEKHYDLHMKPLPEAYVQHILRQISCGLYYLHKSNIIHRDLKMENILLHFESPEDKEKSNILKAQCKIIDFGFAKYLNDKTASSSICGSPISMDPVILKALVYKQIDQNFNYTDKADMWSLGIMFYTMLIGKPPFVATNYHDLYNKINEGNYHIPKTLKLSKQAISLINGMLQYDNKERLSIDQLIFHEFLTMDVENFEYCDLNYIAKGQSDITLNNKEDVKKIWDNYQVVDNKKFNLSEIRGNLSGKSIINEMDRNNCYDANKNFQAFYINEKNNIIFTNGPSNKTTANDENKDKNYKTPNAKDILTEIYANSCFQNEGNKYPIMDKFGVNPTPPSNNCNDNLITESHLQNQISERLKKYEDRGKEFKKITAMLYGELGNKANEENKFTPPINTNIVDLTSNACYESPSPLATTAHNSNANVTSGNNFYRQNTHYNPTLTNILFTAANTKTENKIEDKVTPSISNNQQEIKKAEYKTNYTKQMSNIVNYHTASASTASPALKSKPTSSNFYTNVSDLQNNTIKLISESLYNDKSQGINTTGDLKYYLTETGSESEQKTLNSEIKTLSKDANRDKSPKNNTKPPIGNTMDFTQSVYLGDMRPNELKSNDQINLGYNMYGNYYGNNTIANKSVYKSYYASQYQTNSNIETINPTVNVTDLTGKSIYEVNSYTKDISQETGIIKNHLQEKSVSNFNNNNNTTIHEFPKVEVNRDSYRQNNTNEDIKTAYEIISSGNPNKYNQDSYSKHITSNDNNTNSTLNSNRDFYYSHRNDKGYPYSSANANIYLRGDEALNNINSDNNLNKKEQKFPLSQNSFNVVLEMKNYIDKSVDSFKIENNNAKNNQNQNQLQTNLIRIFDDIKIKMNEALILIEKEGK